MNTDKVILHENRIKDSFGFKNYSPKTLLNIEIYKLENINKS